MNRIDENNCILGCQFLCYSCLSRERIANEGYFQGHVQGKISFLGKYSPRICLIDDKL